MKGLLGLAGLSGPSSLLCEGSEAGPFKVGWANPESGFWIQTSIQQNKSVYNSTFICIIKCKPSVTLHVPGIREAIENTES